LSACDLKYKRSAPIMAVSRRKCCSNARVNAGFTLAYCAAFLISPLEVGKKYEKRERRGGRTLTDAPLTVSIGGQDAI
jgi:hypothetical protein